MNEWLEHPAVQGGVAPLVVALIVSTLLSRTSFAWLAIVAAYLAMLVLSGDLAFVPLTAARKVMLVGFGAAIAGFVLDSRRAPYRWLPPLLSATAGLLALWVFLSVLRQREGAALLGSALGVALFVGVMIAVVLRLRDDGIRAGAAGLGLGLATGISGVLSASIGYLLGGMAVAAAAGAMLLVQVLIARRAIRPGYTGTLTIAALAANFAAGTLMLAELPWYALPLIVVIPLSMLLPLPGEARLFTRAVVASLYALAAAALPILAAWYAARGSFI